MHEFTLIDDAISGDDSWAAWRKMVDDQGWFNKDHSVMDTMPSLATTKCVVAKSPEGKTICHLMWSEYDGLSFIQTFVTDEAHRGKGIGKKVWERAMGRIDHKNTIVMLKSVESMIPFYKSWNLSIEDSRSWVYAAECKTIIEIFTELLVKTEEDVPKVRESLEEDLADLIKFDTSVTGRDRSVFLKRYHSLENTYAFYTKDKAGNINGVCCITPTSLEKEKHLYKLAPVYTSCPTNAIALMLAALRKILTIDENAKVFFVLIEDTRGFKEFDGVLSLNSNVLKEFSSVVLTSKPLNNQIDRDRLFIANNNDCHFDA